MFKKPLIPFDLLPFSWGMKGKTREIAKAEYELSGKELDYKILSIKSDELSDKDLNLQILKLKLKYNEITEYDYNLGTLTLDFETESLSHLDFSRKKLRLDLAYNKINESEFYRKSIDLIVDKTEKRLAEIELDLKEGKLTEHAYEKAKCTITGEPWVNVIDFSFSKDKPDEGGFELDWNEHFITSLKNAGYPGSTEDELVNIWFMTVCKNVALDEFDGVGTFNEDVEANIDSRKN